MSNFDDSIHNLSEIAENLNEWGDWTRWILTDLEEKFQATQIGLEVWIPISIDEESDKTCKIGWAEVDGERRLAYRTHETRSGRHKDTQAEYTSTTISRGALRNAPRPIRIQAMRQLEPLIRKLSTVADQHLGPIGDAHYWSVKRYRKIEES